MGERGTRRDVGCPSAQHHDTHLRDRRRRGSRRELRARHTSRQRRQDRHDDVRPLHRPTRTTRRRVENRRAPLDRRARFHCRRIAASVPVLQGPGVHQRHAATATTCRTNALSPCRHPLRVGSAVWGTLQAALPAYLPGPGRAATVRSTRAIGLRADGSNGPWSCATSASTNRQSQRVRRGSRQSLRCDASESGLDLGYAFGMREQIRTIGVHGVDHHPADLVWGQHVSVETGRFGLIGLVR